MFGYQAAQLWTCIIGMVGAEEEEDREEGRGGGWREDRRDEDEHGSEGCMEERSRGERVLQFN